MCCCLILFHSEQLGGPVSTYSLEVEPEHPFTLRLLEARVFSRVFLQWIKLPSENDRGDIEIWMSQDIYSPQEQKNHMPQRESIHISKGFCHFFPLDIPLSSLSKQMSLSFCNYPIGADFFLNWFCCMKNRLDNTVMFVYLPPRCTLFIQISGINLTIFQLHMFSRTESSNNFC